MDTKTQIRLFQDIFGETLQGDVYCDCGEYFKGPVQGIYMHGTAYVFSCKCMRFMRLEAYIRENDDKIQRYNEAVSPVVDMSRAYPRGSYRGLRITGPLISDLDDVDEDTVCEMGEVSCENCGVSVKDSHQFFFSWGPKNMHLCGVCCHEAGGPTREEIRDLYPAIGLEIVDGDDEEG
jgi:hypothetical protein